MLIQNNSTTRPYTIGGIPIPPSGQATIPDEYYDDIQGITDLQLIGTPPVNTQAMTRRSTQTLYNSDGSIYGIVDSDGKVTVTGRINPFAVTAGQSYVFAVKEGDTIKLTGNATAVGTLTRVGGSALAISVGERVISAMTGVQTYTLATTAGSIGATVGDAVLGAAANINAGRAISTPLGAAPVFPFPSGRKARKLLDFSVGGVTLSGGTTLTTVASISGDGTPGVQLVFGGVANPDGIKLSSQPGFAIQSGTLVRQFVQTDPADNVPNPSVVLKFSSDNNSSKSLQMAGETAYIRPGLAIVTYRAGEDGTLEYQLGQTWTAANGQVWGDTFNYYHLNFNNYQGKKVVVGPLMIGGRSQPILCFTFDSVHPSLVSVVAPFLASYGLTAGVFCDGDMTTLNAVKADLLVLKNTYGWSIGTQGITHTDYQTNGRDITADFLTASANMVSVGLPAPTTFAYPLNSSGIASDAALAALGVTWRRGSGYDILNAVGYNNPGINDGMIRSGFCQHLGNNWDQGAAYQQIQNRLKMLVLSGGVLSLFTHSYTSSPANFNLGADLSQLPLVVDQIRRYQKSDDLLVLNPEQIKSTLAAQAFV